MSQMGDVRGGYIVSNNAFTIINEVSALYTFSQTNNKIKWWWNESRGTGVFGSKSAGVALLLSKDSKKLCR